MATTPSYSDKTWQELEIACAFLPWYNLFSKTQFSVLGPGVPPEPDVLLGDSQGGERIGIEVATAYYGPDHARADWERRRGKTIPDYQITQRDSAMNTQVLEEVGRLLQQKSEKCYTVRGRLLLVVFTFPWRLYLEEVEENLKALPVPASHPFHEIYVVSQNDEAYCLFPKRGSIVPDPVTFNYLRGKEST